MNKARCFLWLALSLAGGVLAGARLNVVAWWLLASAAVFLSLTFVDKKPNRRMFWLGLALFSLGFGRMELAELSMPSQVELQAWEKRKLTVEGRVVSFPERDDSRQKMVVKVREPQDFPAGKILVFTSLYRDFQVGDEVKLTGKLNLPPQFEDFNYRAYLNQKDIVLVTYFPKVEVTKSGRDGWAAKVQAFRVSARDRLAKVLPEPHAGILSATLLGFNDAADKETLEKYNRTGTRHIIAVSGSHMVIVMGALLFLLLEVAYWNRRRALWGVAGGVLLFLLVSGMAPSAVRSGLMIGVMLLGMWAGRPYSSLNALLLAAGGMLIWEPRLLFDIGFQMSFLAVAGMVLIYPRIKVRTEQVSEVGGLKTLFLLTLSAQIFLLPLLIFNFNGFSVWSFPANLLILPFTPLIMVAGFALLLVAFVSLSLAKMLMLPVFLMLAYQDGVVSFFASLPGGILKF